MSLSSEIKQAALAGNLDVIRDVQLLCRFSNEQAAHYCGVSPQNYRRWRNDRTPTVAAVKLLAVRAGVFPWDDWLGWEVSRDRLFAPGMDRRGFRPGHVLALPYLHAQISELRLQIKELRAELDVTSISKVTPIKARAV